MQHMTPPSLYDPRMEHDACGMGFVAHIKGQKSHSIVSQGLEILTRMSHRGACGCDPETSDGAGILVQIPHAFFARVCGELGLWLPKAGKYGVGQLFLPFDPVARAACERIVEETIESEGQAVVGWRDVPYDDDQLGFIGRDALPVFRQVFVLRRRVVPSAFERKLFVIRKLVENRIQAEGLDPLGQFHFASMSCEKVVYKGLVLPERLEAFYPDLSDPEFVSALSLVHSRFSTNTLPKWKLAQPFHYIAHNGEINTLQGNRNSTHARRSIIESARFGGPLDRLFPIVVDGTSDSAQFDNMLELLYLGGRSLPHAIMMMIPEAWENNHLMSPERKAFYQYASSLMEPWDGPAAIAFTNGHLIGATLDRNGLRPARYMVTEDDRVILASETGVLDVAPEMIRYKGRLTPGRMLLVDMIEGRIVKDKAVKQEIVTRWPYQRWLDHNVLNIDQFPHVPAPPRLTGAALRLAQHAFGYDDEDVQVLLRPMARLGKEPLGSMGSDTPLAVLSDHAPPLSHYFLQRFAQVTNPPIDPIRESLVMSVQTSIGPDGNTFEESPEQCHRLDLPGPVLRNGELAKIRSIHDGLFESFTLPMVFDRDQGPDGLTYALDELCKAAAEAVDDGYNLLVLSDRTVDAQRVPIPALLAASAVHQHLVRDGTRTQCGLVVETGEARAVHHFAVLFGFGVAAVNPYLALDTVRAEAETDRLAFEGAQARYIQAIDKGLLKVMSKMGISTLASYRGSQIFEAIGLNSELINEHFTGTPARIEGIGLQELAVEAIHRHDRAYLREDFDADELHPGGYFQWRRRGERHKWNPTTISKLQASTRQRNFDLFREYSHAIDDETDGLCTLRGMLEFAFDRVTPVPLDEVEPVEDIVTRFVSGAMSFGSISAEAHETLAIAMNRLGAKSNSGEGGEEARRYELDENGDDRRSAIHQVASGRFGVTTEYLVNCEDLQIKMAQGAKPGEGGQLPGHKVNERIAKVRCSTPGVTLISPPPHHDIYSIEDLAQLIYDLHTVNTEARVSVKLVSEVGVGTVAAGVAKAGADCVVVAGYSGGTGASPLSSLKHAGLPWEFGLAEAQQVLVHNQLRGRVRLQVDGGLRTGRDVVVAALLGAEEFGFATSALIVEGCVMLRKCHLNTCSVGIATQDDGLRRQFAGRAEHIVTFFQFIAEEIRELMAKLGFRTMEEMIGRVELLRARSDIHHWKAKTLDLQPILDTPQGLELSCSAPRQPRDTTHLDDELITAAETVLGGEGTLTLDRAIQNTDRAVGAKLSGLVARRHGSGGLPDNSLTVAFKGSAGQSFGAFLARGVTFSVEGDTNDYTGKGLCGGRLIVRPPRACRFKAADNIIIGNTVLYGATGGELFVSGKAGERFAVRNSGAVAVVEGVGDHGCEYMTGGVVVVLGRTGWNFAAGMSGGQAFVYDPDFNFDSRCNTAMVVTEPLVRQDDMELVHGLIKDHVRYTDSKRGRYLLDNWRQSVRHFVKVMPVEYRRVLQARAAAAIAEVANG